MVRVLKFLIWGVIIIQACSNETLYRDSRKFSGHTWPYQDSKAFDFQIADSLAYVDLILNLNHTKDYPFENLYVNVHTRFPNDSLISDLISIELADRFGKWYGKCSANTCRLKVMLRERVRFPEIGKYRINFEQFTRVDSLHGIMEMEFVIRSRK